MAIINDPRAAGFNEDEFRDAIKFAMRMGLPESVPERATFRWTTEKVFTTADPAGKPYGWTTAPSSVEEHEDVAVDVAVEFQRYTSGEGITSIGEFQTPSVILTLLDVDYAEIEGSNLVLLGENTYEIDYVAPPFGLFGVTVYQIYARANDES